MKFFDCNCIIGRRTIVNKGSFFDTQSLVESMNRYGIEKALVYHSMSREYAPLMGNEQLIEEIKDFPQLIPSWIVMPHHTGEFPQPEQLLGLMKKQNVKAVRMFPSVGDHNFLLSEWNCGELFTTLEKHKIPLFIGIDQINWNELYAICKDHPHMRIVLTHVNYRINRNLYPLFKLFDNLFIETCGYKVNGGIGEICKEFGSEKLLFGSNMPIFSGSAAVSMINYAEINQDEKKMIAAGNLDKLLGEVAL